jgi:acyl-coenzyme A thioesterase PaaI-like protein
MANVIASALARISKLPKGMQNWATNFAFRRAVPYVGTSKVHYEKVSEQEWIAHVPNKRSVQNHLGQVHAGAMMVVAESVAVTMMGMSLPSDRIPLVKSLDAKFVRRSSGRIRAIARLTDEQLHLIKTEPKGEVVIEVDIRDETGEIPAVITVVPAWTTRRKK